MRDVNRRRAGVAQIGVPDSYTCLARAEILFEAVNCRRRGEAGIGTSDRDRLPVVTDLSVEGSLVGWTATNIRQFTAATH
jgi:hypothetical protein